jgi:hypothetical protein
MWSRHQRFALVLRQDELVLAGSCGGREHERHAAIA